MRQPLVNCKRSCRIIPVDGRYWRLQLPSNNQAKKFARRILVEMEYGVRRHHFGIRMGNTQQRRKARRGAWVRRYKELNDIPF